MPFEKCFYVEKVLNNAQKKKKKNAANLFYFIVLYILNVI